MNHNYVYIYLDPRKTGNFIYDDLKFDNEPFYVGKGSGRRCTSHLRRLNCKQNTFKTNKIKKIIKEGLTPIIIKFYTGLTENDSYRIESELIKKIGRYDLKNGPLTNLNDGGNGGHINPSEESRYNFGLRTRGKTYEEIYGLEKAKILKENRIQSNKNRDVRKKNTNTEIKSITKINLELTVKTKYNDIFILTSPDNEVYMTRNLLKSCSELKIRRQCISELNRGVIEYYKGWSVKSIKSNDFINTIYDE